MTHTSIRSAAERTLIATRTCRTVADARRDPSRFAEYCGTDPEGRPLVQAEIHRKLQRFLSANPKALVELPRDHGKTVQMCARVLWELGRNPRFGRVEG